MALPIRPARADEADAIRSLVRAAYSPWVPRVGGEPLPMNDDYPTRIAAGQAFVLVEGGALHGVVVIEDTPDALMLDNIAVATAGAGHGRVLLDFVEAEARRRGYGAVRLYTNALMTENIALYQRRGYFETGRTPLGWRVKVDMEKRLA